jgi:hypothetical protein
MFSHLHNSNVPNNWELYNGIVVAYVSSFMVDALPDYLAYTKTFEMVSLLSHFTKDEAKASVH